jgi:hypothetical protein
MNSIIKFGLATIAAGTILASAVTVKADDYASELSNPFTKHGLPVPGAYFKSKENQQSATIAGSKSGKGVVNKQTRAQPKELNPFAQQTKPVTRG